MPLLRPLSVPRLGFEGDLQYQNGWQPPPPLLSRELSSQFKKNQTVLDFFQWDPDFQKETKISQKRRNMLHYN